MPFPYAGETAALGTAVCWSFTALAFASAGRRVGSLPVNLIRLVMGFGLLTLGCWARRGLPLPLDASARSVGILAISGLLGFTFGDLCLFRAFVVLGPRLSTLVMTTSPAMTAVAGWVLMGERLTAWHALGMLAIMGGIALAVADRPEGGRTARPSVAGLLLALGGALGQALGFIASKAGMGDYDAMAATQIRVVAGALGFAAVFTVTGRWRGVRRALADSTAMGYTAMGAFFGPFLGVTLSLVALQLTAAGVAATLVNTTPIIILPLGVMMGRERLTPRGLVGAVLAVAGIAAMFLGAPPGP